MNEDLKEIVERYTKLILEDIMYVAPEFRKERIEMRVNDIVEETQNVIKEC